MSRFVFGFSHKARAGVFDMPNSYRYNILLILIFSKIPLFISIFSRKLISISISSRKFMSISIFSRKFISISIFSKISYQYFHRYRYVQIFLIDILSILIFSKKVSIFQKMPIYRQSISIFHHKNMKKLYF